jgi:hypothetical protein
MGAARLGDLVFMVREDQVEPAAMNIEVVAEIGGAIAEHSICQPGRPLPHGLSQPGSSAGRQLPQHEVGRVLLVRIDGDARTGLLFVEIALRTVRHSRPSTGYRTALRPQPR